jgi:hypothetical protein
MLQCEHLAYSLTLSQALPTTRNDISGGAPPRRIRANLKLLAGGRKNTGYSYAPSVTGLLRTHLPGTCVNKDVAGALGTHEGHHSRRPSAATTSVPLPTLSHRGSGRPGLHRIFFTRT